MLKSFASHIASQRDPSVCLLVVAVLPISVFASEARKEAIYIEGTGWLLRNVAALLPQGADLDMKLDESVGGNREKHKHLLSSLTNLARSGWATGTLNIAFAHKETERLIQMADYIAGAALQRRLRNNPEPWNCIAPYVRELPDRPLAPGALKRRS